MLKTTYFLLPLLFIDCSFHPSTRNDLFSEKASLPRDERIHYKNSVEWWYITGHLKDIETEKEYGLEYVFFHFNPLSMGDYLMSNFAISDPQNEKFYFDHVYQRQKTHLDTVGPLNLTLEHKKRNWSFNGENGAYHLKAKMESHEGFAIDISTTPLMPAVLYRGTGFENYSKLGKAGYYSFPRLAAEGKMLINNEWKNVKGELWYDRQWNCGSVIATKVGWDWMSVQLNNGENLMLYKVYKKNKKVSFNSCALIDTNGNVTHYDGEENVTIQPIAYWKSPKSKKNYPIKWNIQLPKRGYNLDVKAVFPDQELKLEFFKVRKYYYWEGMCVVSGQIGKQKIEGNAYLEMTNY